MANKKFFIGFTMGIIGCELFQSFKGDIKPIAVKAVDYLITAKDKSTEFVKEIDKEVQDKRKRYYDEMSKSYDDIQDEIIKDTKNINEDELENLEANLNKLMTQIKELKEKKQIT